MSEPKTAEELAQAALDVGVLDQRDYQAAWSEVDSRSATLEEFSQALLRKGILTGYQLDRLKAGLQQGYFYGDYKVLYRVGSGTFARVFRAAHTKTGKVFAVKVLRSSLSTNPKEAELFRREGELGESLKHENIVPIHEVVSRGTTHYIVMDFIEGRNLREFWKVRKKFDPYEAASIVEGIVSGLHYAFQQGVTHRDLKMSNVLVSSMGVAILVDFGLAALETEAADGTTANQRSIDYAGLERATGMRKDDTRSDIFFAGCIFYQMVSGKPPMSETRDRAQRLAKTRYQDIKPVMEIAKDLPMPLAMVISKAIEFDPQKRYQTPSDMLTDLKLAVRRAKSGGGADAKKTELVSREGMDENGEQRKIMIVESDMKRQDLLRDLFKRNGYRVLVASDPDRAMQRFMDDPAAADVVLFCSATVGRAALEAFNKLGQETGTKALPLVLLLEENHAHWFEEANTSGHQVAVAMPIKLRQLREIVLAAMQPQTA